MIGAPGGGSGKKGVDLWFWFYIVDRRDTDTPLQMTEIIKYKLPKSDKF